MGKVAKIKKKEVSVHSRAARRGTSPTAVVKTTSTPTETEYNPWMHQAQNAGISKKKKNKQLTRQQKVRHAKGIEKGDRNTDKLETKVEKSKARGRRTQARATDWESLNNEVQAAKPTIDVFSTTPSTKPLSEPVQSSATQSMDGIDADTSRVPDTVATDGVQPVEATSATARETNDQGEAEDFEVT